LYAVTVASDVNPITPNGTLSNLSASISTSSDSRTASNSLFTFSFHVWYYHAKLTQIRQPSHSAGRTQMAALSNRDEIPLCECYRLVIKETLAWELSEMLTAWTAVELSKIQGQRKPDAGR
jgi:hypothetical protein